MKLGKGFKDLYKETKKDYDSFQKQLFNAQISLSKAKTKEEALKQTNIINGIESFLSILSVRLGRMVDAAENTFAKDFPDIYEE